MKITLITACFNSAGTIRTAIESVLAQRDVDVEYIVVDGGSTDGTVDVLKEYAGKTPDSQLLAPNSQLPTHNSQLKTQNPQLLLQMAFRKRQGNV